MAYDSYALLPETEVDGFVYGSISRLDAGADTGAGFLQGPDGSRAGIQWELADGPYVMRISAPDGDTWGVYRLGFTRPVSAAADVRMNLEPLIAKLKILYQRVRVN